MCLHLITTPTTTSGLTVLLQRLQDDPQGWQPEALVSYVAHHHHQLHQHEWEILQGTAFLRARRVQNHDDDGYYRPGEVVLSDDDRLNGLDVGHILWDLKDKGEVSRLLFWTSSDGCFGCCSLLFASPP